MKIHFERSGGFAGLLIKTTVDVESLPNAEAQALKEELEKARFFDFQENQEKSQGGADRFQYRLTVETPERKRTLEIGEGDVPDELWPVLRRLITLARSKRNP